jgi:hypothetical protein
VRWGAAIRAFNLIHKAVARLFDKTGKKGEHRHSQGTLPVISQSGFRQPNFLNFGAPDAWPILKCLKNYLI